MRWLGTTLSNSFDSIGKIEIGLYLFVSIAGPDLKSGSTLAYIHSLMNVPDCKEKTLE